MNFRIIALGVVAVSAVAAQAQTVGAGRDYVIEDQGGYTYSDTTNYMNFGVVSIYKSLGILDFDGSSFGSVASVNSAILTLQESDYSSTKPVNLTFWAVSDNMTDLTKGQNTIGYDDGVLGGYSGQLGTATELGTFAFTSTSTGNSGGVTNQQDVIDLTSGLSSLAALIDSSSQNIRILITTDETGYATLTGAGSSSTGVPTAFDPTLQLSVTPDTPEPVSMAAFGAGIVGLIARKRRK